MIKKIRYFKKINFRRYTNRSDKNENALNFENLCPSCTRNYVRIKYFLGICLIVLAFDIGSLCRSHLLANIACESRTKLSSIPRSTNRRSLTEQEHIKETDI